MLGTYANKEGKNLALSLHGPENPFPGILGSNMLKVCEWELGGTGLSEQEARKHFEIQSTFVQTTTQASYYPRQNDIACKLIVENGTLRILGAQLIGTYGATLRANLFALAIWNQMNAKELEYADLGYTPAYAKVWDIIQIACASLT